MEETQAHSCRDDHQPASNIAQLGFVTALAVAELRCFGLSLETLHATLNAVAGLVKSGGAMEVNQRYSDFFEQADALFLTVDERNIRDYFGTAMDYYGAKDFPPFNWLARPKWKIRWEGFVINGLPTLQPLLTEPYRIQIPGGTTRQA